MTPNAMVRQMTSAIVANHDFQVKMSTNAAQLTEVLRLLSVTKVLTSFKWPEEKSTARFLRLLDHKPAAEKCARPNCKSPTIPPKLG